MRFPLLPDGYPLVGSSLEVRNGTTARGLPAVAALRAGQRSKVRRLPLAGSRRARVGRCGLRRRVLESRYWWSRGFVYMILVSSCAGPRCAYVSEHSWFVWVVAFGVCSVFVGASVCAVLLGVVALAVSCSRFLPCTLLCEGLVF